MRLCKKLTRLPEQTCELPHLTSLELGGCTSLTSLPPDIGKLTELKTLRCEFAALASLPDSIGDLENLEILILGWAASR